MLSFKAWFAEHEDSDLQEDYTDDLKHIAHAREWENSDAEACSFMEFAKARYEAEKEDAEEGTK
jgi:hypothetical protein